MAVLEPTAYTTLINQVVPLILVIILAWFAMKYRNFVVATILVLSIALSGLKFAGAKQDDIISTLLGQTLSLLLVYTLIQYMKLHHRVLHSQSLRHLANVLVQANDAVIGKDLKGCIVSWNRGAQQLYGYSPQEAIGQDIRMLLPSKKDKDIDDIMAKIVKGQSIEHHIAERKTKAGDIIKVEIEVEPVFDGRGVVIGGSTLARRVQDEHLGIH